ncbi:hypothetical protein [Lyngbya sp. CCY1209]|uniref:hypothetical protein n=1 Tax=Lyngbya sp. CCY1209 TaxID=2886103 RepID=UPI002D20BCD2|nr:hypothetical protein [Lyngbya sp. CCY1209]MEB3881899.1 hypothetical protein [Lyngbya sp. CCY1209]
MSEKRIEMEGTWEEMIARSDTFAGCKVRVTVLSEPPQSPPPETPPSFRSGSGCSLLRHAGTWSGNDLEDCLKMVYETRRPLEF